MIQTLPCPSCHRVLVLTAEASLQAVLRCGHCSHQFVLGEMIKAEMGFWEVVDDPNATEVTVDAVSQAATEHANEGARDDAKIELAQSEEVEEYVSPQMLLMNQANKKKGDGSSFQPATHEPYERVRRKAKSPFWSMFSVVLGGLASIPIATLLIWHVLGKDPLRMGPVVAQYAPWIVPTRFQPYKFDRDTYPPTPAVGASGFRRFDAELNSSSDSFATNASPADSEPPASGTASESDTTGVIAPPANSLAESPTNAPAPVSPSANLGTASVFTAIKQVEKDLQAWNERSEDRELQKKLALQTYSNLAALAVGINQLPYASPQRRLVRTELRSVGQQVALHTDIQQLIQSGCRFWLPSHQDDLIGLAIVIQVASATEVDNSWHVTPTTAVGEEAIQLVIPQEILPSLSEGQKVFAIGCLARGQSATNTQSPEVATKPSSILTANYVYVLTP